MNTVEQKVIFCSILLRIIMLQN